MGQPSLFHTWCSEPLTLSHLSFQEKCAQYWPSDGLVSYGDITVELKKEEECESYTIRDLLVTNTRVRWLVDEASPTGKPGCSYLSDRPSSKGEQEPADPAVPLPWLAWSGHPQRWKGHDQHHRSRAEAAAAVREPPHHRTLQVPFTPTLRGERKKVMEKQACWRQSWPRIRLWGKNRLLVSIWQSSLMTLGLGQMLGEDPGIWTSHIMCLWTWTPCETQEWEKQVLKTVWRKMNKTKHTVVKEKRSWGVSQVWDRVTGNGWCHWQKKDGKRGLIVGEGEVNFLWSMFVRDYILFF